MKTNAEIKRESLKRTFTGKWFGRMLLVMALVGFANNLANGLVEYFYRECEVQTWADFLVAKLQALQAGMDYAVPSRAIALQMNYATAFSAFIAFIFGGIAIFGITSVVLKAAKEEDQSWCRDSMGGFARPLGVAWMGFVLFVRVMLWSVLFVVPGIVATYRYSQCWNLKVENPDWGAGKCLAESCKLMDGHKMQRFLLDLFFCAWAFALIAVMIFGNVGFVTGILGKLLDTLLFAVCMTGLIILSLWMSVARAIFYRELKSAARNGI